MDMKPEDSITLDVKMSPDDAPKYGADYTAVRLTGAVVVGEGTVKGNPTVDLVLCDEKGNKYVALVKGSFVETIGQTVTHVRNHSHVVKTPREDV